MSLSRELIDSLLARRAAGIPAGVLAQARLHVADTLGIAVAARERVPIAASLRAAFGADGPRGIAAVAAPAEAFLHSAYAHILDYDDIHDLARVHPTAVSLPAALAAAALVERPAVDLVDAVVLSNELMCAFGTAWEPTGTGPGSDWFLTQLFGYFGGALAAGLVLGLDGDGLVSALGLAYMQAAGGKQAGFGVGSNARAIYPAFAAMGGVQAALLARSGIVGPDGALDGPAGFFRIYFGRPLDHAQTTVLLEPGRWVWQDTRTKPFPSCRLSHPFVAAALEARERADPGTIARVRIDVDPSAAKLCNPIAGRRVPTTLQDAKYSIPYMVAFTLVHGEPSLANLDDRVLGDAAVRAMAQRVDVSECLPDVSGLPAGTIAVEARGASFSLRTVLDAHATEPEVRRKFVACLEHAGLGRLADGAWTRLVTGDAAAFDRAAAGLMRGDAAIAERP